MGVWSSVRMDLLARPLVSRLFLVKREGQLTGHLRSPYSAGSESSGLTHLGLVDRCLGPFAVGTWRAGDCCTLAQWKRTSLRCRLEQSSSKRSLQEPSREPSRSLGCVTERSCLTSSGCTALELPAGQMPWSIQSEIFTEHSVTIFNLTVSYSESVSSTGWELLTHTATNSRGVRVVESSCGTGKDV